MTEFRIKGLGPNGLYLASSEGGSMVLLQGRVGECPQKLATAFIKQCKSIEVSCVVPMLSYGADPRPEFMLDPTEEAERLRALGMDK